MSFASDDLAPLVAQQPQGELAGYAQGTILSWDPDTFENVISVRGGTLTNVQVGSGVEAMTYRPGDTVILARWRPGGGMGTWWIDRRIIRPGTGSAGRAIAFMQTALARSVALAVFGEAILEDTVDGSASIGDQNSGNDWINLPGSTGPTITDVEIGETGRAMVIMTARLSVETHTTDAQIVGAFMSYEVSGATSVVPNLARALELQHVAQTVGDDDTQVVAATMSRVHVASSLNAGVHTFTAKYSAFNSGSGQRSTFSRRQLQVIPF